MKRPILVLVVLVAIVAIPLTAAPAVAQNETNTSDEIPGLYENETDDVDNESWMSGREDATLENVTHFATRFGTFVIGNDADSTDSASSSLVLGLIILGAMIGATAGAGVGLVGGGILAIASLFGIIAIDLAPEWFFAVALFLVGVLLSAVAKRQLR